MRWKQGGREGGIRCLTYVTKRGAAFIYTRKPKHNSRALNSTSYLLIPLSES